MLFRSLSGKYDQMIDRESAYEVLAMRINTQSAAANKASGQGAAGAGSDGALGAVNDFLFGSTGPRGGRRDGVVQSVAKSMVRRTATQLLRGVLGSLTGRKW